MMRRSPPCAFLACLSVLALAGCDATRAGYPSLAPRPIEQLSLGEPDRPPSPPAVADPAAVARFAPLIAQAHSADAAFRSALEGARPALHSGRDAATGSDAWLAAQQALSRVETAREPVTRILSQLDAARYAAPTDTSTGNAVAAAQAYDAVAAVDRAERDALTDAWPNPS